MKSEKYKLASSMTDLSIKDYKTMQNFFAE